MKKIRKNLNLSNRWWHRLLLVLTFIGTSMVLAVYVQQTPTENQNQKEPEIRTSLRYTPPEFETTTEKMGCVENVLSQKEKLERYLTRDYFAVPGEDTDKTFNDLNAQYNSYGFLYKNTACYGIYTGSYPGTTFETIVNQDGEVILNFAIVFEINDLYDLYVENFDTDTLLNIKQKIPNIHSGRNTIYYEEYKTILDTLFEGSQVFLSQ